MRREGGEEGRSCDRGGQRLLGPSLPPSVLCFLLGHHRDDGDDDDEEEEEEQQYSRS